jgi:hypothetical protein
MGLNVSEYRKEGVSLREAEVILSHPLNIARA